ncbi:MAG: carboxypeptidase regulatory-like domain-containing protein [Candidatus Thiodiazotropha sp. (ex Notomyrtea botanica)]|nr:carboxypeptidase regulatory-like domain-containing protein [Candidatus Thiodiazotropha sp. (ex Notomyrtea botanica)]
MKNFLVYLSLASFCAMSSAGYAAAYKEGTVSDGGTIIGSVKFAGKDKAPKVYGISKDNDVCGTGKREIDYVRVNNGHLMDTVVYLDKVKEGKPFEADVGDARIDQKGCEFNPFLQVMKNKSKLSAVNSDPILHNIHTYELIRGDAKGPKKTLTNVSQPDPGTVTNTIKMKRGPAIKVECDAHDFMHGFVFVAKNPYYAKVAEDGTFTIGDVPPGSYTIKAWHGMLKNQKAKVKVDAGGTATVDFTFK